MTVWQKKRELLITGILIMSMMVCGFQYRAVIHDVPVDKGENRASDPGRDVVIAVIDSGVDTDTRLIKRFLWKNTEEIPGNTLDDDGNGYIDDVNGWNFAGDRSLDSDLSSKLLEDTHGTCVTSTVLLSYCNSRKVSMLPKVRIMVLKVLQDIEGLVTGKSEDLIRAIRYAECNGASICNMSVSFGMGNESLYRTMQQSRMLFIVAAGNNPSYGKDLSAAPRYPASFSLDNMIVVSSLSRKGRVDRHANYGSRVVDVAATGEGIICPSIGNRAEEVSGTSFSAALVTGMVASMVENEEHFYPGHIKKKFLSETDTKEILMDRVKDGRAVGKQAFFEGLFMRTKENRNLLINHRGKDEEK